LQGDRFCKGTDFARGPILQGDRWFESTFLQQRVTCELDFGRARSDGSAPVCSIRGGRRPRYDHVVWMDPASGVAIGREEARKPGSRRVPVKLGHDRLFARHRPLLSLLHNKLRRPGPSRRCAQPNARPARRGSCTGRVRAASSCIRRRTRTASRCRRAARRDPQADQAWTALGIILATKMPGHVNHPFPSAVIGVGSSIVSNGHRALTAERLGRSHEIMRNARTPAPSREMRSARLHQDFAIPDL
jgi:hypothetical protein